MKLLLPLIVGQLGAFGSVIVGVINIVMWVVIAIIAVYIVFELLSCLLGGVGHPLLR